MTFVPSCKARTWRQLLMLCAVAYVFPAGAVADTIWIKTSGNKPLAFNNVKIDKLTKGEQGEELTFTFSSGATGHRALDQIVQIKSDEDAMLTAAEQAYAGNDMKSAAEGYRKLISSPKPWIKRRAELRLAESAGKSGDLASTVAAFIQSSASDPKAAVALKPDLGAAAPEAIDLAIVQVRHAADAGNGAQRQVLLPFLAELYNARKDTASAQKVLDEMSKTGGPAPAASADTEKVRADVAVAAVREALEKKDYAAVMSTLEASASNFTQPQQQADAMFMLAQAKSALAKNDAQLQDAALAFMRVVANFKGLPEAPHVSQSLLYTAAIEEKLRQPKEAIALYKQVAGEFKGTPAAQTAAENAQRLESAAK